MTITSHPHPANFDRVARPYRYLEYLALGPLLQQTRTHFLPLLLNRKQAMVLGDGDGRFLQKLLAANPSVQAIAIDASGTMLKLLRRRCAPYATRLQTINTNALTVDPQSQTDLIVTHFFLDCLTSPEVDTLVTRLTEHIDPGTLWLISDFRIPTGPMRFPARIYIRALYLAFRLLTGLRTTRLPDYEAPLKRAGFTRTHQYLALFGLLTSELWTNAKG